MTAKTSKQALFIDEGVDIVDGTPTSNRFDDVYYHKEHGWAESQTVFLAGNNLPAAWRQKETFIIGETGFGTGLNFLATLDAFLKDADRPKKLVFFSFDHTPLSRTKLETAHKEAGVDPALSAYLINQMPPPAPGLHPRWIREDILLLLYWGDVEDALKAAPSPVDAWYLDGFSPAKNPDMWCDPVYQALAAKSGKDTTLGTFTAAGHVRRGLEAAGFQVDRVKGFANKRHRVIARYTGPVAPKPQKTDQRWATPAIKPTDRIAIIGAGIAGLSLAWSLKQFGLRADIIASETEKTSSTVPVALLAPRLPADTTQAKVRLMARAFAYACAFPPYQAAFMHPKGLTLDNEIWPKMVKAHPWGNDWWQKKENRLFLPLSGALDSKKVLATLSKDQQVLNATIKHIIPIGTGIQLHTITREILEYDRVILALGEMATLAASLAPSLARHVASTYGQTALIDTGTFSALPDTAFMGKGYAGPAGAENTKRLIGATRESLGDPGKFEDPAPEIMAKLGLPLQATDVRDRWWGKRLETADHMPFVGPLWREGQLADYLGPLQKDAKAPLKGTPPILKGVYIFTGFGSRGYQYAPYMAYMFAEQLTGKSDFSMVDEWPLIHPSRLYIKLISRMV